MIDLVRPTVEFDQRKTRLELAIDLIKAFRLYIFLTFAGVVTALWYYQPDLPNLSLQTEVAIIAGIGAFALGYVPAWALLNYLHNPPKRYIISLGLSESPPDDAELSPQAFEPGIYELTPNAWERVRVLDGNLYQWEGMRWPTYECLGFDREDLEAVGTWRGSKPDSELLRREKEIGELRTNLEQAADHSIDLEIAISSKVRQAVREIGQSMIEEHASATTYDGEKVAEVLSDIRQDIEEDAGSDQIEGPASNGDKPIQELKTLESIKQGGPADD